MNLTSQLILFPGGSFLTYISSECSGSENAMLKRLIFAYDI
jgi:hypothetical protein